MPEPPLMMLPHIAIAPFFAVDFSGDSLKIGEIVPIITIAHDESRIAPIVIFFAVGSKVDIPAI